MARVKPVMKIALLLATVLTFQQTAKSDVRLETIGEAHNARLPGATDGVRLRGVVTAFSGWKNSFFLQDATGSISVDRQEDAPVQVGDEVEVTGHLQPGLFANVLLTEQTKIVRRGLPRARESTYRDLRTGEFDSALVQVTGVVRAWRTGTIWGRSRPFLDLQTGDDSMTVYLPSGADGDLSALVDSQVRLSGVCGTVFDSRRQLTWRADAS